MRLALTLHPASTCKAVTRITVDVTRQRPGRMLLRYVVHGTISDLRLPPPAPAERADGLWRHTCFEAFVSTGPGGGYYEFNFAPSTRWAAYHFTGYRQDMSVASVVGAPRIEMQLDPDRCTLAASARLDELTGLPAEGNWRLGLSAVIEEATGHRSYWALAHPPGDPDFHHSDCFAGELSAAWRR